MMAALCMLFLVAFSDYRASATPIDETGDDGDTQATVVYYKGVVTGNVNVRVDAGTDYDRLSHNGSYIQLQPGDEVLILGEKMVGDKPWYQIRFDASDGTELVGYSTSTYITRTSETITPTPTPEPTPTPTLTPTPTPTPTPSPSPSPTPVPSEVVPPTAEEGQDFKLFWTILGVVAVLIVLCVVLILIKNRMMLSGNSRLMTQKMKKIKEINPERETTKKNGTVRKKKPEIRTLSEETDHTMVDQTTLHGRMFDADGMELPTVDAVKASAVRESEEKRALRTMIDELNEHDLVEHKYFGIGEVYDNSDVKLLEVRFGSDVRFLNKDSLVAKRLLSRYEGDADAAARGTRRK